MLKELQNSGALVLAVLNKSAISVSVFDFSQLAVLLFANKIIASKASVEALVFV